MLLLYLWLGTKSYEVSKKTYCLDDSALQLLFPILSNLTEH